METARCVSKQKGVGYELVVLAELMEELGHLAAEWHDTEKCSSCNDVLEIVGKLKDEELLESLAPHQHHRHHLKQRIGQRKWAG